MADKTTIEKWQAFLAMVDKEKPEWLEHLSPLVPTDGTGLDKTLNGLQTRRSEFEEQVKENAANYLPRMKLKQIKKYLNTLPKDLLHNEGSLILHFDGEESLAVRLTEGRVVSKLSPEDKAFLDELRKMAE